MPIPPDKTGTLLVEHLRDKPVTELRDHIITAAQNLHYDDFLSDLAMPKTELYYDLINAGYEDLAKNVKEGVYD